MDLYTVFKFLHVLSAIAWVGGGLTLFALTLMLLARKDDAAVVNVVDQIAFLGTRWFIPTSMITLIFGLIVTFLGNLWGDAWVVLGLLGFANSFVLGMFGLKPLSEAIARHNAEGRPDLAAPLNARILQIGKFDYTVLVLVIADMVMKPAWNDYIVLGLMALVVAVAAYAFLLRRDPPAQALA